MQCLVESVDIRFWSGFANLVAAVTIGWDAVGNGVPPRRLEKPHFC